LTALLSAQSVSYCQRERPLVNNVSLDVVSGQMTVVIGPNGAGKSTLLRLLSGELQPTSGVVSCEGRRLGLIPPWMLATKRAVMTQSTQVSFDFTAREVVQLGIEGLGRIRKDRRAQVIDRCLEEVDAIPFASRRYNALSGGEQRRIQFARALAQVDLGREYGGQQALLLDEPVANLDLKHQLAVLDAAKGAAQRGLAVLAILHDFNLATRYNDSMVVMNKGAVAACGRPSDVFSTAITSDVFDVDLTISDRLHLKNVMVVPSHWSRS
jgi:iron complex transport system ATP-binding protein